MIYQEKPFKLRFYMEEKYYNALNLIYKGSYPKLQKTWNKFKSWEQAFKKEGVDLDPDQEWKKLEKLGIKLTLQNSSKYPHLLKEAPTAPFGLYVLGNLQYKEPAIAIVGTRKATPLGKELAENFARKLSSAGITIISGLAMGIDEASHKGTVKAGNKTIAVLGTPLNNIYPKQNEKLGEEILKNDGAIISEFPLENPYQPENFLIRNRIISGLANGILIIEAPERSGALATAKFALEQNREIFIVPGNVQSSNYRGSNALIKAGANLVTEPEDILSYFNINIDETTMENKTESDEENKIIKILKNQSHGLTIEELQNILNSDTAAINRNLAMLTIKCIIKESNGKYYLS